MSTAERSASAVDRGIGQLAQNFKRSQRDAPQDDAAPGLTLRRQHGPVVAFFTCRGMNLYAHTLGRASKCYALGQAEGWMDFCNTSLALSYATKRGGYCRSLERHENFAFLGLLFLVGGVFQLPDLLEGRNESLFIGFLQPVQRFFLVGRAVNACRIQETQVVLSLGITPLGSLEPLSRCFPQILLHALVYMITENQNALSLGMA